MTTSDARGRRRREFARAFLCLAAGILVCGLVIGAGARATNPGEGWRQAEPRYAWAFPKDHWAHRDFRTEWWYLTGNLACAGDRKPRFGYQFTFFRIGIGKEAPDLDSAWTTGALVMGHAAITDFARGRHHFGGLLRREMPLLGAFGAPPDPLIAWARAPAGTDGIWSLRWNGSGFDVVMRDDARGTGFSLTTRPLKPLILQGPDGYSRKGHETGAASLYYSFTRLATEGSVRVGDVTCEVTGESWMDKEFGSRQLGGDQSGWDWFGLQLDDGRELMLYRLRRKDGGTDFRNGTLVPAGGAARPGGRAAASAAPRFLEEGAWTLRSTATWRSPETGAVYPSRWIIELPGERLRLEVVPRLADQENRGAVPGSPYYGEGAVDLLDAAGGHAVQGYVELTGYGDGNRPPI